MQRSSTLKSEYPKLALRSPINEFASVAWSGTLWSLLHAPERVRVCQNGTFSVAKNDHAVIRTYLP